MTQQIKIKLNDKQFESLVAELPFLTGELLAAECNNLELWQGLKHCFDPKARLYQYHALAEENSILLESCPNNFEPEERKWRDELDAD